MPSCLYISRKYGCFRACLADNLEKKLIEKVKYKNQKKKERCGLSDNFALKNKKRMEKKQSLR